jgi:glutamate-1-semialdehyde 2,1-aminomutase
MWRQGTVEGKYFAAARRLADEHGALLICDEVITLRLGVGGFQEVLGIRPDLMTMGKIIGGLPVGAFGGRADVMAAFDPRSPDHLHHSGTFNGNLMTMAAGCVTLDLLTHGEIECINALGERLAEGLRRSLAGRPDLRGVVNNYGSLLHVNFGTEREVRNFSDLKPDSPIAAAIHLAALDEGVYFAPRGSRLRLGARRPGRNHVSGKDSRAWAGADGAHRALAPLHEIPARRNP